MTPRTLKNHLPHMGGRCLTWSWPCIRRGEHAKQGNCWSALEEAGTCAQLSVHVGATYTFPIMDRQVQVPVR